MAVKKAEKAVGAKKTKEKAPTDKLADKTAMTKFLQGIFGDAQKKILKHLKSLCSLKAEALSNFLRAKF